MDLVQTFPPGVFPLAYLPPEILHIVFAQLDENQDLTAVSRVCKLFFEILSHASFNLHEKMFRNGRGQVFIGGGLNTPVMGGYEQNNRKFPSVFIKGKELHVVMAPGVSRWEWDRSWRLEKVYSGIIPTIPSNFTKEACIACLVKKWREDLNAQIYIFGNRKVSEFSQEEQGPYNFKQLSLQEGFLAALGSKDDADYLIVFSLPSKEVLHTITFEKTVLCICSDQKSVVIYFKEVEGQSERGKIRILDVKSGKIKESFLSFEVSEKHMYLDEGKIIAATVNGRIASIDVETGEERTLNRWKFEGDRTRVAQMVISNHQAALFSNDGDFYNYIEVYDLKKWEPFACFPAVSDYNLLGIVFQNHLLAAFGLTESNGRTLTATIWDSFFPYHKEKKLGFSEKEISLSKNETKPFFPAYQRLATNSLIPFTDVSCKMQEFINDDSQSFLCELPEIEEIDDSKEQQVSTVSTGSAQEAQTLESQVPAPTELPPPEPQVDVEAEAGCCSWLYSLCACFKWLFHKIFN